MEEVKCLHGFYGVMAARETLNLTMRVQFSLEPVRIWRNCSLSSVGCSYSSVGTERLVDLFIDPLS